MTRDEQFKFIQDNCPATTHHKSKRLIRHSFFKNISTEIQAYLLGFYVADGSIDEKRKTLRINVNAQDAEIVYLYQKYISQDARIFFNKGHDIHGRHGELYSQKPFIGIDVTSVDLANTLVDLGYGYRKTYLEMKLPELEDDLILHFIRGYFDGDGSIFGFYRKAILHHNERVSVEFSIVSKTSSLLLDIQKFLAKYNIKLNLNYSKRDNMYSLRTSSKHTIEKIFTLLYKNANFYLSRKYHKFNYYVNTEVSQLIADHRNAQKVHANESNNPSTSAEHPTIEDENIC